jgi:hypothetical protein
MFVPFIYIYCPAATVILEGSDLLSEESCIMPANYFKIYGYCEFEKINSVFGVFSR